MTQTVQPMSEMQKLAQDVAQELGGRVGVDGAFVFVMRRGDDTTGCGIRTAADVPYDVVIGCIVQLLGELRRQLHEKLQEQKASKT